MPYSSVPSQLAYQNSKLLSWHKSLFDNPTSCTKAELFDLTRLLK